jgi:predicted ferric reductase
MSSPLFWYASRATGLAALVLLTTTMALGVVTATRLSSRRWPGFATQELHRRVSLTALVFLAFHILTSVLDIYVHIGWFAIVVPFTSSYKPLGIGLGAVAVDMLLAVAATSILRHRIQAHTWRALHWLAYFSWPVAVVHGFTMGTDMRTGWVIGLTVACVGAVAAAGSWRLISTTMARRRASSLSAVRERPRGVPVKRLVQH